MPRGRGRRRRQDPVGGGRELRLRRALGNNSNHQLGMREGVPKLRLMKMLLYEPQLAALGEVIEVFDEPLMLPGFNEVDIFISQKLKDKIWNFEYIDLSLMHRNNFNSQTNENTIGINDGMLVIQNKVKKNHTVNSVEDWTDCFIAYAQVLIERHPDQFNIWALGTSPVNVNELSKLLELYHDKQSAVELLNGFKYGFKIHYEGPRRSCEYRNLLSVLKNPIEAQKKLNNEISLAKNDIWIIGSSLVKKASEHTQTRATGIDLGLEKLGYSIVWIGHSGMLWHMVPSIITALLNWRSQPSIILIHCGGNDLCNIQNGKLLYNIKDTLRQLMSSLPNTTVIWSYILPRRIWMNAMNKKAIERARARVNRGWRLVAQLPFGENI
ncbi:unnamed protein product [Mytilus edulis]|uniref:SGNH hydrolase-type esterase domain-containing protein n=1 Tax=Mytilus edulis TaxID=6550 RepID=A0A8S3T1N7_MYTED|nr:unnamed protein product [Mytilus edulis]